MQFGHEQLDVYRLSIDYVAWSYRVLSSERNVQGKARLIRLVSMLTKLGRRDHELREEETPYGDNDNDEDGKFQQMDALATHSLRQ